MNKELTDLIIQYMQDDSARYAIALEGAWGSGKTRYCDTELTNKLYPLNFNVLRVSLFGVESADEVYSRLVMAMTMLKVNWEDKLAKRFFKSSVTMGAQALYSYGRKKLLDAGVTIEATPQMLTGLLNDRYLLVFDDVERFGAKEEGDGGDDNLKHALYGLVNNLIEMQECKVMFVTNSFEVIPSDIREKVVWKCYRFQPSPGDLVKDIIVPEISKIEPLPEFDVTESLVKAAQAVSCRNARAMIKATPLLKRAIACNALLYVRVDAENRERAFRDFAAYAFQTAMNVTSSSDSENDKGSWQEAWFVGYDASEQLRVVKDYFDPKLTVTDEDIETCLKEYIEAHYAGSPDTMRVRRILEKLNSAIYMEDSEVATLAADLSYCISHLDLGFPIFLDAFEANVRLGDWGFAEALSEDQLSDRMKQLIDNDPKGAYKWLHHGLDDLRGKTGEGDLLKGLDAYLDDRYEEALAEDPRRVPDPRDQNVWQSIVEDVDNAPFGGKPVLFKYEPEFVAKVFECGDATVQNAIYDFLDSFTYGLELLMDEQTKRWFVDLRDSMAEIVLPSTMGKLRRDITLKKLDNLLK